MVGLRLLGPECAQIECHGSAKSLPPPDSALFALPALHACHPPFCVFSFFSRISLVLESLVVLGLLIPAELVSCGEL